MRVPTSITRYLFLAVSVAVAGSACGPDDRTESVADRQKADGRPVESGQRVQFSARRTVLDYSDRSVELPEVDTATLRASYGDAETFGRIAAIYPSIEQDVIVVADQLMDPHLVTLDMESGGVLDRFGPQGQGPGELRQVSTLFRDSAEPLTLGAFDAPNQRLTFFSVTGEGGEMSLVSDISFTAGNTLLDLVPLEDGMFAANGGFGADFRIGIYNGDGRNVLEIETENPSLIDETVRKAQLDRSLLTSRLAKRPGGHRIALAFSEFNRIEVIDIADSTYQVIKGPRPTTPSITPDGPRPMNINQRKHEQAYFGIAATEDRIYAAFCGCVHRPSAVREGDYPLPQQIQVFDWEGNLKGIIPLDRDVREIAVPKGDSVMYASYRSPAPYVGEWRIPVDVRPQ